MIIEQWDLEIKDQSTDYILKTILDTVTDRVYSLDEICDFIQLNIEELICRHQKHK